MKRNSDQREADAARAGYEDGKRSAKARKVIESEARERIRRGSHNENVAYLNAWGKGYDDANRRGRAR